MDSNKNKYLYMKLANILREQITSELIKPGEFLMSENELSAFYGMSRISVRKTLELLAQEGLIVRKAGHGTKVAEGLSFSSTGRRKLHICVTSPSYFVDLCMSWIIEAFQRDSPDVQIVLHRLQSINFWESLENVRKLGFQPDVILVTEGQYREIGNLESFLDIELPSKHKNWIYPKLTHFFSQNDQLKGMPITFTPVIMAYNPDIFEQFDVPKPSPTWNKEDFLDAAQKLSSDTDGDGIRDQYGLSLNPTTTRWAVIAMQNGVDFANLDSNPEPFRNTLQFLHRLLYHDRIAILHTPNRYSLYSEPFINEKAAMVLTTAAELAEWVHEGLRFHPLVCPMPFGTVPSTLLQANALMVPDSSNQPDLARSFLHFMIRPDVQEEISRKFHFLSVLYPVNERVRTKSYLFSTQLHDHKLEHCTFINEILTDWKRFEELDIQLQLFWKGLESVDSTMLRINQMDFMQEYK